MSVGSVGAGGVARPREAATWLRWVLANLVGEAIGFGLGMGLAFALALPFGKPEGILLVLGIVVEVAVVGIVEGLSVGLTQHWVLGPLFPSLARGAWIGATVPGAIVAWGVGMALGNWEGDQLAAVIGGSWLIGGLVVGILAGAILSGFQWVALRRVARRAWIWVPAHSGAWAIGMLVAFAGIGSIADSASMLTRVETFVAVGVGMGAAVAALTGLALLWVARGEE